MIYMKIFKPLFLLCYRSQQIERECRELERLILLAGHSSVAGYYPLIGWLVAKLFFSPRNGCTEHLLVIPALSWCTWKGQGEDNRLCGKVSNSLEWKPWVHTDCTCSEVWVAWWNHHMWLNGALVVSSTFLAELMFNLANMDLKSRACVVHMYWALLSSMPITQSKMFQVHNTCKALWWIQQLQGSCTWTLAHLWYVQVHTYADMIIC